MIHRPTATLAGHPGSGSLAIAALLAGLDAAVLGVLVVLALLVS